MTRNDNPASRVSGNLPILHVLHIFLTWAVVLLPIGFGELRSPTNDRWGGATPVRHG